MVLGNAAVLTGDIVASRRSGRARLDAGIAALSLASDRFAAIAGSDLRFTRYRGDGWQVLLDRPDLALRAMICLRAALKAEGGGLDTRIAAGFGAVETGAERDLSGATGPAFFASGEALDTAGDRRYVIALPGWPQAVAALLDAIVTDWTAAQAEAAAIDAAENLIQADIAKKLGITRQAVQQRLAGAKMGAVRQAIETFEATHGRAA